MVPDGMAVSAPWLSGTAACSATACPSGDCATSSTAGRSRRGGGASCELGRRVVRDLKGEAQRGLLGRRSARVR